MMSEITELHDRRRRDVATALVEARLDSFDTHYVLLDQLVSAAIRDTMDLRGDICGRQRRSVQDLVSRIRSSMDRVEAAFAEPVPVRHLQAAE